MTQEEKQSGHVQAPILRTSAGLGLVPGEDGDDVGLQAEVLWDTEEVERLSGTLMQDPERVANVLVRLAVAHARALAESTAALMAGIGLCQDGQKENIAASILHVAGEPNGQIACTAIPNPSPEDGHDAD